MCRLTLIEGEIRYDHEWLADRELAKGLLKYLHDQLHAHSKVWRDITAIGVYEGPGSFTGLRIGMTVLNTLADSEAIPIVGGTGESWQDEALTKIHDGKNEQIVLPRYGSDPIITKPRK
jgi:tRNA threonylcarbamoyladenosine biosynthesis protein TsaB